jgi:hypothetical protein
MRGVNAFWTSLRSRVWSGGSKTGIERASPTRRRHRFRAAERALDRDGGRRQHLDGVRVARHGVGAEHLVEPYRAEASRCRLHRVRVVSKLSEQGMAARGERVHLGVVRA